MPKSFVRTFIVDPTDAVEQAELIARLKEAGYANLLDALLDVDVYTSTGRLNLSGLARKLGIRPSKAAAIVQAARQILESITT